MVGHQTDRDDMSMRFEGRIHYSLRRTGLCARIEGNEDKVLTKGQRSRSER
jgi:hypothetical protein